VVRVDEVHSAHVLINDRLLKCQVVKSVFLLTPLFSRESVGEPICFEENSR